jgi:Uma2 family endonuclease
MTATAEAVDQIKARPDFLDIAEKLGRLRLDEAERRERHAEEMVPGDRSEFINGEIVMPSPFKLKHIRLVDRLHTAVRNAAGDTGETVAESALCRFPRNDYYPDICFWPVLVSEQFHEDQTIFPPPLFAVEVLSPATEDRDRGVKFVEYAVGGVREYWIVDPDAKSIEQYLSDERQPYRLLRKLDAGRLVCESIDGLSVDVAAIFE